MEDKTPGYYESVNVPLLEVIPLTISTVLEVGCGAGRFGEEYKKRNPACTYYGIEINPDSAADAVERLDHVTCDSVEKADLSFLSNTLDCIIFGDVLEHLIDPWATLRMARGLLRDGGKVITCIPNIQHWTFLRHLLSGNWVYSDQGLLDTTHLRFFTLNSIYTLFGDTGYKIEGMAGVQVNYGNAMIFLDKVRPALVNLGIDEEDFLRGSSALQYLVVAAPDSSAQPT